MARKKKTTSISADASSVIAAQATIKNGAKITNGVSPTEPGGATTSSPKSTTSSGSGKDTPPISNGAVSSTPSVASVSSSASTVASLNNSSSSVVVATSASPSIPKPMSSYVCHDPEAPAPLHICLPVVLPFGRVVIPRSYSGDFPPHHYSFKKEFPSASNFFSRAYGLCNQSPAWLVIDVGYLGCKEHQVPAVATLFNRFLADSTAKAQAAVAATPLNSVVRTVPQSARYLGDMESCFHVRAQDIRLRTDSGSGWYLYEIPVETCTATDYRKLVHVMNFVTALVNCIKDNRLCQAHNFKATEEELAIVVLKQEGQRLSDKDVNRLHDYVCEGIEVGEIRLVRQKPPDRPSFYEPDPRFLSVSKKVLSRPIACDYRGVHARRVFAPTNLPRVYDLTNPKLRVPDSDCDVENDHSGRFHRST